MVNRALELGTGPEQGELLRTALESEARRLGEIIRLMIAVESVPLGKLVAQVRPSFTMPPGASDLIVAKGLGWMRVVLWLVARRIHCRRPLSPTFPRPSGVCQIAGYASATSARKTRLPAAKPDMTTKEWFDLISKRAAGVYRVINNRDKSIQSGLTGHRGNHIHVQHAGVVVSAAMEFASNRLDG